MSSDEQGRFYVTSALGVQVFDGGGRECGLLPKPQLDKPLTSCTLAGPDRGYLYITNGDRIYRRKVQAKGSYFGEAPAQKNRVGCVELVCKHQECCSDFSSGTYRAGGLSSRSDTRY